MGNEKRQSSDFLLITIGLLTGFFLGAGIVYWYSNQPQDSLITDQALERLSRLFQSSDNDDKTTYSSAASGKNTTQKQGVAAQPAPATELSQNTVDPFATDTIESDFATSFPDSLDKLDYADLYSADDITLALQADSIFIASGLPPARQEDIRVARDRLIGVKGYSVPVDKDRRWQSESSRKLDSLIGGATEPMPASRIFYIEFWESPLNYSAYKMGANRVILYGFDQIDEISLQLIDNTVFLKYFEHYFGLSQSADFKPLIPVSNIELLTKLEQLWP